MWKQVIAFLKSAASSYQRLADAEEDVKKLQSRASGHDEELSEFHDTLIRVLFEFEKVRMQMESDKQIAGRDYENLVLRLQLAMRDNDQRALPPAPASQEIIAVILTRLDALEKENEALKRQFEEWKRR